ncbi:MAG: excinuclease ABC subunit UvrA [Prevotella sp.]|nr:excinuclease ABC subunit UvrA [Candidatus Prevotella equi]
MKENIKIKGARVNNLKNVSVNIPRNTFVAIAGVSGSGKSSLAFDTLYAEGQRRYVESLSSYARQFLGRMSKPECDFILGLPPAIAIEQKVASKNPRSTVGTSTEIYEFMRLLFARIGKIYSPISNIEVKKHTPEDVVQCMLTYTKGTRFMLLAPLHVQENRTPQRQLEMASLQGYSRIYYKEEAQRIDDFLEQHATDKVKAEDIWLLIDRMSVDDSQETISRLTDSTETAFYEGQGTCRLIFLPSNICYDFSTRLEADGLTFEEPTDGLFAFNSPVGVCQSCEGFGKIMGIDENLVIPNPSLSVYDGCVQCWHGEKMGGWRTEFIRRAAIDNFPIFTPYCELSEEQKGWLWHGLPSDAHLPKMERVSIDDFFQMVRENQYKIQYRVMLARYRGKTICPECHGTRLRKEANYVKVAGKTITELVCMPITELAEWFHNIKLDKHSAKVAERLLTEINSRLQFLLDVGLGYLTLNRPSNTLSGGESQRINLTTSLGSSLVGSLYILDEPSIGMHSRDTERLIGVLRKLQKIGNTVVVVEHDEELLRAADYLIDVGPDAGVNGGEIVFEGNAKDITIESLKKYPRSHTIEYLTGTEKIDIPESRRPWNKSIILRGARMNNLKGVDAEFPLNVMTVVTGVSGSGKSSLIRGTLYPIIKRRLDEVADIPGTYSSIEGDLDSIHHIEMVDQNPIGKSTRSNPATYIKAYDAIRQLFASQPLAQQMNITPQYFSFNTDGGRCEECKGAGVTTVEMQFMADLTLTCEACHGKRFKREVLEVRYEGKNIDDILRMTVSESIAFFSEQLEKEKKVSVRNNLRAIVDRLLPLDEVGLGYIQLGQSSSTLSGGENQRVKLAYYISQERQEPTLFIFDEPTTGLHFHDIKKLLHAFNELIKRGHTIIIIEHNMDVIKCADHIIDIGPEGGDKGGEIVATGTPEEVSRIERSITGQHLNL